MNRKRLNVEINKTFKYTSKNVIDLYHKILTFKL